MGILNDVGPECEHVEQCRVRICGRASVKLAQVAWTVDIARDVTHSFTTMSSLCTSSLSLSPLSDSNHSPPYMMNGAQGYSYRIFGFF